MNNYTNGPWHVGTFTSNVSQYPTVETEDGYLICNVVSPDLRWENAIANARLIAAAPELLAALKSWSYLLANFEHGTIGHNAYREMQAAITKAEGEQK